MIKLVNFYYFNLYSKKYLPYGKNYENLGTYSIDYNPHTYANSNSNSHLEIHIFTYIYKETLNILGRRVLQNFAIILALP